MSFIIYMEFFTLDWNLSKSALVQLAAYAHKT